jgi:hypothetical protein
MVLTWNLLDNGLMNLLPFSSNPAGAQGLFIPKNIPKIFPLIYIEAYHFRFQMVLLPIHPHCKYLFY